MDANRIIEILADGEFHSGESLGQSLGVSRTAVWKQIGQLEKLGLEIHSVKGKGYRLSRKLELLSEKLIRECLDESTEKLFRRMDIKTRVNSTNDEVKAKEIAPYVCLAETQSSGRGRRGRSWISPYGSNIYLSLVWEFEDMASSLDGLSLCVGIAVARAINKLAGIKVGLKWPNDLVYQQKKLAGILLELEGEMSGPMRVIIGIGVNVAMTRIDGSAIEQSWVSLSEISDEEISRNKLTAQLLTELAKVLPVFQAKGFAGFREHWQELDAIAGSEVLLSLANRNVQGCALGVSDSGELLIASESGIQAFRGGEVSVRVSQ